MKPLVVCAILTYAAIATGATVTDPSRWCSNLLVGFAVFLFLPVVMALSMLSVSVPLVVFVLACGTLQRNSGAGEVARDIVALPAMIVPGYIRALRGVHSPALWGFVLGAFLATATLTLWLTVHSPDDTTASASISTR